MIQGRCPICARTYAIATLADLPSFPFCCERCRLVDLGRWIDGAYVLPGQERPPAPDAAPASAAEDEDDPA
jgi:endogenous inhibitor of DNA gyrase (YacG/DUF329 family)